MVLFYWVTVIIGALDVDFLDFDIDLDADVDVDVDVDVDPDLGASSSGGISWLNQVLYFFNLGRIPFMIWLSFLALVLWFGVMNVNYILGIQSFLPGLITLVPGFILSLFIAKFLTMPFIKVFASMGGDDLDVDLTGSLGHVKLTIFDGKVGQVNLVKDDNSFVVLAYAKVGVEIKRGTQVLLIDHDEQKNAFLVEPYNH